MKEKLADWDMKAVSKWWQRGVEKERQRLSNSPKSPKRDRFSTPTNFRDMVPTLGRAKKPHAR